MFTTKGEPFGYSTVEPLGDRREFLLSCGLDSSEGRDLLNWMVETNMGNTVIGTTTDP